MITEKYVFFWNGVFSQWQGTNWLGEAIMSVREKLR